MAAAAAAAATAAVACSKRRIASAFQRATRSTAKRRRRQQQKQAPRRSTVSLAARCLFFATFLPDQPADSRVLLARAQQNLTSRAPHINTHMRARSLFLMVSRRRCRVIGAQAKKKKKKRKRKRAHSATPTILTDLSEQNSNSLPLKISSIFAIPMMFLFAELKRKTCD